MASQLSMNTIQRKFWWKKINLGIFGVSLVVHQILPSKFKKFHDINKDSKQTEIHYKVLFLKVSDGNLAKISSAKNSFYVVPVYS